LKNIDDLIPDIHALFDAPHECNEDRLAEFGQALSAVIGSRLKEVRGPNYLRISNLGKGDRQLYYDMKTDAPPEVLDAHTKIKFLYGDILELMLIFLAEEAGHTVENKQAKVNVNGVLGSMDCTIDGVLVDCKSASTYAFKKFKDGTLPDNDSFGYMEQLAGYSKGLGDVDGAFLAIDKTLGHIALSRHSTEELAAYKIEDRIDHIKSVLEGDELPERCYGPEEDGKSGNLVLGVNCSYCRHKFTCWQDSNGGIGIRTFIYSTGPKHFVNVSKEPNGPKEVTF